MRIFYFLSDFFSDQFDNLESDIYHGTEDEKSDQSVQMTLRMASVGSQLTKLLDLFYEEVERFKETGSFEVVWADIVFDPNDE